MPMYDIQDEFGKQCPRMGLYISLDKGYGGFGRLTDVADSYEENTHHSGKFHMFFFYFGPRLFQQRIDQVQHSTLCIPRKAPSHLAEHNMRIRNDGIFD